MFQKNRVRRIENLSKTKSNASLNLLSEELIFVIKYFQEPIIETTLKTNFKHESDMLFMDCNAIRAS